MATVTVTAANAGWKDSAPIGNHVSRQQLLYADSCKQAPSTVHPATQEAGLRRQAIAYALIRMSQLWGCNR